MTDQKPTARQLECLEAYLYSGSIKEVAHKMGVSEQQVKNHLTDLYSRLGVEGHNEAYVKLGWVYPGYERIGKLLGRIEATLERLG